MKAIKTQVPWITFSSRALTGNVSLHQSSLPWLYSGEIEKKREGLRESNQERAIERERLRESDQERGIDRERMRETERPGGME